MNVEVMQAVQPHTTRHPMEIIDIQPTRYTPTVLLDGNKCVFEIRGVSMPEDAPAFFDPIISWIKEHKFCKDERSAINFYLDYFNTSSAKMILEMMLTIDQIFATGSDIVIGWYYHEDDEQLKEVGEEYAQLLQCPLILQVY